MKSIKSLRLSLHDAALCTYAALEERVSSIRPLIICLINILQLSLTLRLDLKIKTFVLKRINCILLIKTGLKTVA